MATAVAAIAHRVTRARASAEAPEAPALSPAMLCNKNGRDVDDVAAVFHGRTVLVQVLSIRAEMAKETMPAVMQNTASR